MAKKDNKKENSKNSKKIEIVITVLYTLIFCYWTYVFFIMPDKLSASNIIILVILLIPYLLRLIKSENLQIVIVGYELIVILFSILVIISWPTIKKSLPPEECQVGEEACW